nr:MAG TPA: hypothetical protein [Caudoviricetes sp.]
MSASSLCCTPILCRTSIHRPSSSTATTSWSNWISSIYKTNMLA